MDVLKPLGGIINLKEDNLNIQQIARTTTIKMHEEEVPEPSTINQCNLRGLDTYEELTMEEIQAKVEFLKTMSQTTKNM